MNEKVTIGGKEYTMKNVSLLGIKIRATKHIIACNLDKILEWIGDEEKEKIASDAFTKFVNEIIQEKYDGESLLNLKESEVAALTALFFAKAIPPQTPS